MRGRKTRIFEASCMLLFRSSRRFAACFIGREPLMMPGSCRLSKEKKVNSEGEREGEGREARTPLSRQLREIPIICPLRFVVQVLECFLSHRIRL